MILISGRIPVMAWATNRKLLKIPNLHAMVGKEDVCRLPIGLEGNFSGVSTRC